MFALLSRRDAQQEILKARKLPLSSLSALVGSEYHALRNDPRFKALFRDTSRMLLSAYGHQFVSADFGHRALKEGDSRLFRDRVQTELKTLKDRLPIPLPLLTPCGVTVLYIPPIAGAKVDLDNLVRKPSFRQFMTFSSRPPRQKHSCVRWKSATRAIPP